MRDQIKPKFKRAITYGTFDLFHVGHLRLLRAIKNCASEIYVGVSSDEFNALKGKRSIIPFSQREEVVASCRYVDHVFREDSWEQKRSDIKRFSADLFVMGSDWEGKFDFLSDICEVLYLPRTPDVSSTDIKRLVSGFSGERVKELKDAVEIMGDLVKALG